uniref:Uncharacterized protein n=1 Tax=Arundo donax TaxID=35708 RepID=A0A0A9ESE8_ARUDO
MMIHLFLVTKSVISIFPIYRSLPHPDQFFYQVMCTVSIL